MNEKLTFDEAQIANLLRGEILKNSESLVQQAPQRRDMTGFELISTNKVEEEVKPYVSPIFSMSEDEILAFVEEFEVGELATLSVPELNRIGEVLGVDTSILVEGAI